MASRTRKKFSHPFRRLRNRGAQHLFLLIVQAGQKRLGDLSPTRRMAALVTNAHKAKKLRIFPDGQLFFVDQSATQPSKALGCIGGLHVFRRALRAILTGDPICRSSPAP
jgi:hypothetical protein